MVPSPPKVLGFSLSPQAAAASGPESTGSAANGVPSASIRCRTQASLRAKATFALRTPARFATASAQRFSAEPFTGRVRMMFAASYSAVRTAPSPIFEIRPVTSVSPD
jgi:hypothetical protein